MILDSTKHRLFIVPGQSISLMWIREITRGSVMCCYFTTNELIYDRMNTLYNSSINESKDKEKSNQILLTKRGNP